MNTLTIKRPDDWHCHLRDGEHLARTVPDTAARFQRAIIMPNLATPVTTVVCANKYQEKIEKQIPPGSNFTPLMTLYLTDTTTADTINDARGIITACKLYPAGATTHSKSGVTNLKNIYPALEAMQTHQIPLLIHGEVTDPSIDIFDREAEFIETDLRIIYEDFPNLKIVLEHITTKIAVEFIQSTANNVAATITPQHLLFDRNQLFKGGIQPHYYCLPILKRSTDQHALIAAAISGNPKFFLGTDSAPHSKKSKESACGCAGIYSANAALEIYTEIFDKHQSLDKLEGFASIHGANFYNLPLNQTSITLIKKPWTVPASLAFGNETVVPLLAGETLQWQIQQGENNE